MDWHRSEELAKHLGMPDRRGSLTLCSSEGGLFEYGSDDDIVANLSALRESPEMIAVIGSVTRADEPVLHLRKTMTSKTRPRGLSVFQELVAKAGWKLTRAIERPFSDQVVLT